MTAAAQRSQRTLAVAAAALILLAAGLALAAIAVHRSQDPLAGFGTIEATITAPNGSKRTLCLLRAVTNEELQRGLMAVTDPTLAGHDGMLFMLGTDQTSAFWMRDTPMPLKVIYLDARGAIVSAASMKPCNDSSSCHSYPPAGPYRYALEVPTQHSQGIDVTRAVTIVPGRRGCIAGV